MLVRALLERGYKDWHLRRIDLRVYAHNLPAIRCYEAEGFVREGVLRQGTRVADMLWDVVLMAHFRDAWVTTNAQRGEIR
jgi:RimJ/RimL family protein N-acetyltransferase